MMQNTNMRRWHSKRKMQSGAADENARQEAQSARTSRALFARGCAASEDQRTK
jgi:hypothetical protein